MYEIIYIKNLNKMTIVRDKKKLKALTFLSDKENVGKVLKRKS